MAAAAATIGLKAPEPMPSYAQMLQRSWASALAAAQGCGDCGWGLARRGLVEHAHLAAPELLLAVLCALGWTALRSAATTRIFRVSETWGPPENCIRESEWGLSSRSPMSTVAAGKWGAWVWKCPGCWGLGLSRDPLRGLDAGVWLNWGDAGMDLCQV